MSLTGIPLIVLAFLATGGIAAGMVGGWSRSGRGRYAVRVGGVLLCEALLVFAVGLVVNRADGFYPSWAALAGRIGTTAAQQNRAAGRLDGELAEGAVTWHPHGIAAWHLSGGATLSVPAGYEAATSLSYPVVVELRPAGRMAAPGAVTVTLPVSAKTTVASLATLPAELGRDVRVGGGGWAVVAPASPAWLASLAQGLARRAPQRYVAVGLVGSRSAPVSGRSAPVSGRSAPVTRAAAPVGGGAKGGAGGSAPAVRPAPRWFARYSAPDWTAAVDWAAGQTAAPLAAPVELPKAVRP